MYARPGKTAGKRMTGGNRNTRRKPCFSAAFSIKNLIRPGLGLNPTLSEERMESNRLNHGTGYAHRSPLAANLEYITPLHILTSSVHPLQ